MMPKLVLTLDSSKMVAHEKCQLYAHYSYVENLRSPYVKQKAADKGTIVHLMLQIYYTLQATQPDVDKLAHSKTTTEVVEKLWFEKLKAQYRLEDSDWFFIKERFTQYVFRYYSGDFKILLRKGVPSVEVGFSKVLFEDENYLFIVDGRLDFIGTVGDELVWGDHKTQGRYEILYKYKPQFLTYAWATGVRRAIINYFGMQTNLEPKHFHRQVIFFEEHRIKTWEGEMLRIFHEVARNIGKSETEIPQKLSSCGGPRDAWACIYANVCETENLMLKQSIKANYFYKREKWIPWSIEETEGVLV